MAKPKLREMVLYQVKNHLEVASSCLTSEAVAKEKSDICKPNNPLFNASHNITQARWWIEALLEDDK